MNLHYTTCATFSLCDFIFYVHSFTRSLSKLAALSARFSRLTRLSAVPSVPSVLFQLFLSLYFLSASCAQSPSLLLVPGPSWHCHQTPGISSRPTLAGRRDANKTLWLLLRLLECYSFGRNRLLPSESWI